MINRLLIATALTIPVLHAQDGGQLYSTYCAACHGANGEGALNGQFPPLAGSPWPMGNPDRAIKIVLAGLHGEVEVNGKTWNLEMPPQGAALPDDQIAAILTYVRSSWGNKAEGVETSKVAAVRAALGNRATPWTSAEILKLHPLDIKPPIADLLSYVYDGTWKNPPDFTTLKPAAGEEEHAGFISLSKVGKKDHYGVVWEGTLEIPADGNYEFYYDADDGGRLILDGKTLIEIGGIGPIGTREKISNAAYKKGPHKLRVEYYEFEGQEEVHVGWRKKGEKNWMWLSDKKGGGNGSKYPYIPIAATSGKTAVYRNFIAGTSPRAIGIGFPDGVNFAWSADRLAPELIWQGDFMNGGHHWTERGQGAEPPAGDHVVKLSNIAALPVGAKFLGYQFNKAGNPTFAVQIGKQKLLDAYAPGTGSLSRTLTLSGDGPAMDIFISESLSFASGELGKSLLLEGSPIAPSTKGGKTVLTLAPGQSTTLTYRWK